MSVIIAEPESLIGFAFDDFSGYYPSVKRKSKVRQKFKENTVQQWGIHWFRRDLRISGNAGLRFNLKENKGRVVGLFCIDRTFLSRPDFSHHRFAFFLETLGELRSTFRALGGELIVLDGGPESCFKNILQYCAHSKPATVTFNRDYEPYARQRDATIERLLMDAGVCVRSFRDHLLIEPHELSNKEGRFYQVYTPFARRWIELLATQEMQDRIAAQAKGLEFLKSQRDGRGERGTHEPVFHLRWNDVVPVAQTQFQDVFEDMKRDNGRHVKFHIPQGGEMAAFRRLNAFDQRAVDSYGDRRDIPSVQGTSGLSIFFKNGSLVSAQVIQSLGLTQPKFKEDSGANKYLKELIWREFYYHVLWHRPDVETTTFQPRYKDMTWDFNQEYYDALIRGNTGFPIVDAGMRQLVTTGLMHNRVRMIVASFMTKDLLLDWRLGEKLFMNLLLDGDLAPNNGGWQWSASTGCDAQPYFRIFNPVSQSERFDSEGLYIKKYVPELSTLSADEIHCPSPAARKKVGYPQPIVDHGKQRIRAMMLYQRFNR
jgi:deoxyribodipyrimidine photo-lyase